MRAFCALAQTQWQVVVGLDRMAYIGLRYEALPMVLDMLAVPAAERFDVFWGLQVMERVAVRELNRSGRAAAARESSTR